MSNNLAMSGVSDADAGTACTGDVASKSLASKVPAIIFLSGIKGDDCDVNVATQLLVTDPDRSGCDTSSSVQFDPSSGTGAGANFSPNFSMSGPLPQIVVVATGGAAKPDSPVPSGIPFLSGSQDGQTTAGVFGFGLGLILSSLLLSPCKPPARRTTPAPQYQPYQYPQYQYPR